MATAGAARPASPSAMEGAALQPRASRATPPALPGPCAATASARDRPRPSYAEMELRAVTLAAPTVSPASTALADTQSSPSNVRRTSHHSAVRLGPAAAPTSPALATAARGLQAFIVLDPPAHLMAARKVRLAAPAITAAATISAIAVHSAARPMRRWPARINAAAPGRAATPDTAHAPRGRVAAAPPAVRLEAHARLASAFPLAITATRAMAFAATLLQRAMTALARVPTTTRLRAEARVACPAGPASAPSTAAARPTNPLADSTAARRAGPVSMESAWRRDNHPAAATRH